MKARITKMFVRGNTGAVKAFFNVALGEFEIRDCRLIDTKNGLFVGFPSRSYEAKDGTTKYVNLVALASDEDGKLTPSAQKIYNAVFEAATAEFERRSGTSATSSSKNEDDDLPF